MIVCVRGRRWQSERERRAMTRRLLRWGEVLGSEQFGGVFLGGGRRDGAPVLANDFSGKHGVGARSVGGRCSKCAHPL